MFFTDCGKTIFKLKDLIKLRWANAVEFLDDENNAEIIITDIVKQDILRHLGAHEIGIKMLKDS